MYKDKFLITEKTSTLEQKYFIDKHKFSNRLANIEGVIYGLQVEVDRSTGVVLDSVLSGSIYPGCAIDKYGRTIIVTGDRDGNKIPLDFTTLDFNADKSVKLGEHIKKDGNEPNCYYLMIAYNDIYTEQEQVIQEGYKFCVMSEAHRKNIESVASNHLPITIKTYEELNDSVIINLYVPKYIEQESLEYSGISVWMNAYFLPKSENTSGDKIKIECTLELDGYKALNNKNSITKELEFGNTVEHRFIFALDSIDNTRDGNFKLKVTKLVVNGIEKNKPKDKPFDEIDIAILNSKEIEQKVIEYNKFVIQDVIKDNTEKKSDSWITLARIAAIPSSSGSGNNRDYKQIKGSLFEPYKMNSFSKLRQFENFYPFISKSTITTSATKGKLQTKSNDFAKLESLINKSNRGVYEVDSDKLSFDTVYESDVSIPHKLKDTQVTITFGIACKDDKEEFIYFGNPVNISDSQLQLDITAKVLSKKEEFKILIKPLSKVDRKSEKIYIHWFAVGVTKILGEGDNQRIQEDSSIKVNTSMNYVAPNTEIDLWKFVGTDGNYKFYDDNGPIRSESYYMTPTEERTYQITVKDEDTEETSEFDIIVSSSREGR